MYQDFRLEIPASITHVDMYRILVELGKLQVKSVTFTGGGEPLCNSKVFPQAFHIAYNNDLQVGLVTNGLLIDKYAEDIVETCTFTRISLDATTSNIYSILHGVYPESFSKVLNNVLLLAKRIDTGLAFLVHPLSQVNQFRKDDDGVKVFCRLERFKEIKDGDKNFSCCLATPLVVVIRADLKVALCCQWRHLDQYVLGDLKKESFTEIWLGEKRGEIVESIDVSKCPPCRYRGYNIILEHMRDSVHRAFL